jgi:hypothetical protein
VNCETCISLNYHAFFLPETARLYLPNVPEEFGSSLRAEAGRLAGPREPLVQREREKAEVGAAPSRVLDGRALMAAARASRTLLDRCSNLSGYLRANRSAVATRKVAVAMTEPRRFPPPREWSILHRLTLQCATDFPPGRKACQR